MLTGVLDNNVAAKMGNAEFLAPEIRSSPDNFFPPVIISLSMFASEISMGCFSRDDLLLVVIYFSFDWQTEKDTQSHSVGQVLGVVLEH